MKRILVPVDFSPTSQKAFRFAADIASRNGGNIILYHLYTPEKNSTIRVLENVQAYNQQLEINSLKRLQRLKKKILPESFATPVSTIVGRTPIVNNILGFAEHNHIDMIIMGTQGASGIKKIIIGSVASKIIEQANIPVLLIPEKFEWKEPEKIIFTTNFEKADRKALPVVFDIARLYGAMVSLVHILDPHVQDTETEQRNFETYAYEVKRKFNDSVISFKQLKTTSIIETMEQLHNTIPYDMLAMARRKLSFLERFFQKSFTKNMAYITTQPLLMIPEDDDENE